MSRGETYTVPIVNRDPCIGGIGTCLCVGLVPTLTGRGGIAGSSVGAGIGCESFGGEGSGDSQRNEGHSPNQQFGVILCFDGSQFPVHTVNDGVSDIDPIHHT